MYDDFMNDPWPFIKQYSRTIEGRLAIYGSLLCAVVVLIGGVSAHIFAPPKFNGDLGQTPLTLKIGCKANGHKYLYGVILWVKFGQKYSGETWACRDLEHKTWIPANPALSIQATPANSRRN